MQTQNTATQRARNMRSATFKQAQAQARALCNSMFTCAALHKAHNTANTLAALQSAQAKFENACSAVAQAVNS
jgi:hypothetical protein